jgi:outer membrane protein assembly factor BamE (lipoprotein component of BamABCDE complex)
MIGLPRKKEIGAMRIGAIVFIAAFMLVSCAHLDISKNAKAISQVKPGDTQEEVFQILGAPDFEHDISDQRVVAFYQTTPASSASAPVTMDLCTPIAFENGKVVTVGEDLTAQWTGEEDTRKQQTELAALQRQQAERARAARQQAEAEHQDKIRELEDKVKPVPTSNAALNLKLYRQLHELAPNNPRYQEKVAFYEERLALQDKARQQRALRLEKARQRAAWEKAREARNIKLRQYSGNGTAEIAVHDMGNGSLYVWIKNVSRQIITTHPDYFTLIDGDNKKMRCEISDSLDSVLEPGSISHGKIEYDNAVIPKELIFENRESGRISKSFE